MTIDRPIIIAVTLFVILLLIFFLVVPQYNTFKILQTQLAGKTAEFNAQHDYYSAIDATYLNLQGHKDDVVKIDDALPQNPVLANVVYFLQKTAGGNGLIIKDLFLSKSSSTESGSGAGNTVKDITFSIDLTGSYASLENFIVSLEKSSRIFEVTNISFGSPSASAQQTYSFSLQIKTYSY